MQNDDLTSIKYLMKELDPAEAVLFEQRMMEDEELLEEVECMRCTLRRLEKLPVKNPPSELTEYVIRKACARNCSSAFYDWWSDDEQFSMTKYYAAAALILVGMGIGLLSFQYPADKSAVDESHSVTTAEFGSGNSLLKVEELQNLADHENEIYMNKRSTRTAGKHYLFDTVQADRPARFRSFNPHMLYNSESLPSGNIRLTGSRR